MKLKEYSVYAYKMQMIKEREIRFVADSKVENCVAADKLMRHAIAALGQTDRENFMVAMMNVKLKPVGVNLVSMGGLSQCPLHPREVIKAALGLPCAALIIGHNHPSGDISPSREDTMATRKIIIAAEFFGIDVLDHIIVDMASDRYYSYAEHDSFKTMKREVKNLIPR